VLGVAIMAGLHSRFPLGRRFLWLLSFPFLGFLFSLFSLVSLVRCPARGRRVLLRSKLLGFHSFGGSVTLRA
jgi:hypothetical protein